jgi:hypothetical protein
MFFAAVGIPANKGHVNANCPYTVETIEVFPDEKIVVSLIRQLSWTHILAVIPIDDPLKRTFYIEMCILEKWSVRTFRERIQSAEAPAMWSGGPQGQTKPVGRRAERIASRAT